MKANAIGARSTARGAARSTDDFVIVRIMAGATEKGTAARYSARKDGLRESNMLTDYGKIVSSSPGHKEKASYCTAQKLYF